MKKKTIFFSVAVLCLLIAALAFYWYQKPRTDLVNAKPDIAIGAKELYAAFETNEQAANKKFIEKVIRVKGIVKDVQATDSTISILLATGNDMGGINCSVPKGNNLLASLPVKGSDAQLKGRCVGFLMDVNLVDAVVEK